VWPARRFLFVPVTYALAQCWRNFPANLLAILGIALFFG